MTRTMFRAKVHRIRVTECDVAYEGSLTLDTTLMSAAKMIPYERIEVYNIDNGKRFATYLIEGEPGSGQCCVNGAAAHMVTEGNRLILATYTTLDDAELAGYQPTVVVVDDANKIKTIKSSELSGVKVGSDA
jgi:aspartate 1-decarboxylase